MIKILYGQYTRANIAISSASSNIAISAVHANSTVFSKGMETDSRKPVIQHGEIERVWKNNKRN